MAASTAGIESNSEKFVRDFSWVAPAQRADDVSSANFVAGQVASVVRSIEARCCVVRSVRSVRSSGVGNCRKFVVPILLCRGKRFVDGLPD
jgi:hypothetical protein